MTNRLDPEHLRQWRKNYQTVVDDYMRGAITLTGAANALRDLGFKYESLKVELTCLEQERNKARTAELSK